MKKSCITILLLLTATMFVTAQKLNIGFVYPSGGLRGSVFEVEVGGQNFNDITGIEVSGSGVTGEIVNDTDISKGVKNKKKKKKKDIQEQDNLQIAERVKVRISISANAPLGIRDFRLKTGKGYSNRLFFEVSQYPEMIENKENNLFEKAQKAESLPMVLNGQILAGTRDYFSFHAQKGQTIVCQVKGRTLIPYLADAVPGWFQPVLTMYNSKRQEVAYCDDYWFDPDPVIICDIPETGEYTLQISDAIFRGREDFVYRIDVGEIPFIRSVFPLGGKRNAKTRVRLDGVNLKHNTISVKPGKQSGNHIWLIEKGKDGYWSNAVPFEVGNCPEVVRESAEIKTNRMEEAAPLLKNTVVNACISKPGEEHWYAVSAKKKAVWMFSVTARKLNSPIDACMAIFDSKGRKCSENDDMDDMGEGLKTHHADPGLTFKFPDDGVYFLRVTDRQNHGGSEYAYRLKVGDLQPDYELQINPANIDIPKNGTAVVNVSAIRKLDFKGEIDLKVKGLPAGYRMSTAKIDKGENLLRMTITAPGNAVEGVLPLHISGRATGFDGSVIEKEAFPAEEWMQAFYISHLIPTSDFKVNVTPELPLSISAEWPENQILLLRKDSVVSLKVKIDRRNGMDEPVSIILSRPPWGVRMPGVIIPAGESGAVVNIECFRGSRVDRKVGLIFSGVVKPQKIKSRVISGSKLNAAIQVFAPLVQAVAPKYPVSDKEKKKKK